MHWEGSLHEGCAASLFIRVLHDTKFLNQRFLYPGQCVFCSMIPYIGCLVYGLQQPGCILCQKLVTIFVTLSKEGCWEPYNKYKEKTATAIFLACNTLMKYLLATISLNECEEATVVSRYLLMSCILKK